MTERLFDLKAWILLWLGSAIGVLSPIKELLWFTVVFVFFDYVLSVIAKRTANKKRKKKTEGVIKELTVRYSYIVAFSVLVVSLSWILNQHILPFSILSLETTSASTICVFSLVNIVKNSAYITKSKAFHSIRKHIKLHFSETTK